MLVKINSSTPTAQAVTPAAKDLLFISQNAMPAIRMPSIGNAPLTTWATAEMPAQTNRMIQLVLMVLFTSGVQ